MNRSVAIIASLLMSVTAKAQEIPEMTDSVSAFPDSIFYPLDKGSDISSGDISDNPMYFKLFMPLVLYGSAVSEAITPDNIIDEENDSLLKIEPIDNGYDPELAKMIDETLVRVYLEHPELVRMTEEELRGVPGIIPISSDMLSGINLKEIKPGESRPSEDKNPDRVKIKPHYWKVFGNFQGKYTQSYYSENWYKGGESNHSILGQINTEANFAKNHTTFDNKLELKLGYHTTEINGKNTFRTNDDLIRFTSKYGLRAIEGWYYSAQFQGYTQFMPVFDTKVTTKLKSKFFSPAYGNVSVGMDYKPKFKNKNITLSVLLSPLSYNCRYVSVDSIATNFGIEAGKNFKYTIGSRFDGNVKWKFLNDFTWTSKAQYYTSYESVEVNLENTLDYKLSKYFSLQFFCHWRFDDSVKRKKDKEGNLMGYGQFKEFFTLNFNYQW